MTKITIESANGTNSVETDKDIGFIDDLIDLFGALLIGCGFAHENVCDYLNTETFNPERLVGDK